MCPLWGLLMSGILSQHTSSVAVIKHHEQRYRVYLDLQFQKRKSSLWQRSVASSGSYGTGSGEFISSTTSAQPGMQAGSNLRLSLLKLVPSNISSRNAAPPQLTQIAPSTGKQVFRCSSLCRTF